MLSRSAEVGAAREGRPGAGAARPHRPAPGPGRRAGGAARGAGRPTTLAAAELKRYQELRDQGFISGLELERRETDAAGAAGAARPGPRAGQRAGQPGRAMRRCWRRRAGVVTAVEAEPGAVLAAGTPVVRLAHDGPRDVVFAVPEDGLAGMRAAAGQGRARCRCGRGAARRDAAGHGARGRRRGRPGHAHLPGQGRHRQRARCSWARRPPCCSSCRAARASTKLPLSALMRAAGPHGGVAGRPADDDGAGRSRCRWPAPTATRSSWPAGLSPGQTVVTAGVHVLTPGQKVQALRRAARRPRRVGPAAAAARR